MSTQHIKIAWITSHHQPQRGGMANSSERIVKNLWKAGFDVLVIHLTSAYADHKKKSYDEFIIKNWHRVKVTGVNVSADRRMMFQELRNTLAGRILLGFGGTEAGYLATLWAKWLGEKSFVMFRGNDFEKNIQDVKTAWITHYILENAAAIGAVSLEMTADIANICARDIYYTPNSVDIDAWSPLPCDIQAARLWKQNNLPRLANKHQEKKTVTIIGQLKNKKGLAFIVDLFLAYDFFKDINLLTIGDLSEAAQQHLGDSCGKGWKHIAFVTQEQLPTYYAASDIICIPSMYDGMPNVLLEAMAMGRVVFASRAGGIPDVIEHGHDGFLFDVNSLSSAATVFEDILQRSATDLQSIASNARKKITAQFLPSHEQSILLSHLEKIQLDPAT